MLTANDHSIDRIKVAKLEPIRLFEPRKTDCKLLLVAWPAFNCFSSSRMRAKEILWLRSDREDAKANQLSKHASRYAT